MQPTSHSTPIRDFDFDLLPADARKSDSDAFKTAVISHFSKLHQDKGESALVLVEEEEITVLSWQGSVDPMHYVLDLMNSGRFLDAAPLLRSIAFSQPQNAAAFFNLGITNLELEQFEDAIVYLEQAVKLDPSLSDAWFGIGMSKLKQGDVDAAINALTKAVETDPDNAFAQRNLAGLLNKSGRFEESLNNYRTIAAKLPNDPQVIFGTAQSLENLGGEANLKEADALYLKLMTEFPGLHAAEYSGEARARIAERLKSPE